MGPEAFADHVGALVATSMRRYDVPGVAVALVYGGTVAWTKAFGFADLERAEPMTTGPSSTPDPSRSP